MLACGHAADAAASTDEALILLSKGAYDVALVDLEMPGRNGLDLLDAMRASGADVVSILLTGTTNIVAAVDGMKRGAFDYLPKPAEPEALRWTVARSIGVARARRRERALERVVADWASTFDACPDLLLVIDADDHVLQANLAVARRTGTPAGEAAGRRVGEVLPGGLGAAVAGCVRRLQTRGDATPVKYFDPDTGGRLIISVNPIRAADGPSPGVVVVVRDMTELALAEEVQARLYRELLTAQEDERGRIARELHDGIGQEVVSLALGLSAAAEAAPPGEDRDRLEKLRQGAAETLEEIRRMAQGLRPMVLDDLGLVAALERLTDGFTRLHGVRAEVVVAAPPSDRLPREVESAVYRIVQEAMANVAKHARARTADVTLEVADRCVRVSVTDDGDGFAIPDRPRLHAGLGLSDMRERAVMLGGTFRVDSSPGRGTTIDIMIPLREDSP
ncbi:histidine kinase [Fimbriiglobus ruber]|uniref:Oxygen sensor histidine kinase NreB n=1 Tax=Fimbriiglobus ruber TaxID=1908690 RepID=A0A225E159_9BACT|nr:histidine kinase [Fimbriiglobus ruber]OWK44538.1 Sensor histidine kinase [Fimbriiglobus ruber]